MSNPAISVLSLESSLLCKTIAKMAEWVGFLVVLRVSYPLYQRMQRLPTDDCPEFEGVVVSAEDGEVRVEWDGAESQHHASERGKQSRRTADRPTFCGHCRGVVEYVCLPSESHRSAVRWNWQT